MRFFIEQVHQVVYTWLAIPRAIRFIRYHELWQGMWEYKWVRRMLLFVGALISLYMLSELMDSWERSNQVGVAQSLFAADGLLGRVGSDAYESLTGGSLKWIILILLEVVTYHFMRQSLKIVDGKDTENAQALKPFIDAQGRMIAVSFMAYGLEIALTEVGAGIITGIFSFLNFLEPSFVLLVKCGLIGYAMVDNYYEQFGLKISQSFRYAREGFIGVCLGVGIPLYFVLKVPLLGALAGPLVASVTVAIVMHELCDLNEVGYIPTEKEKKKMERDRQKKEGKLRKQNNPSAEALR